MRTPAETCRKMRYLLIALTLSIALAACGGGGTSGGSSSVQGSPGGQSSTGSAVIQGKVSGPVFIAIDNDTNLEAGRSTSAVGLTTFSMTLPTGKSYMFYLLDDGVMGNPSRVFPVYMGMTNVFRITSDANGQTIDLGLVNPDLTGGMATPANNLMACPGVMAWGENRSIPPFLFGAGGTPFHQALYIPPVLTPASMTSTTDSYDLAIREADVEIIPGKLTRIMGFNGLTPGPTIRARVGRQVVMSHTNGLPVTTLGGAPGDVAIHLHGGHVPSSEDGFPTDTILPGATRSYTYPNNQLPATLWYHDHVMGYTGPHVWFGMAGFYILTDDYEDSLGLPSGRLRNTIGHPGPQLRFDREACLHRQPEWRDGQHNSRERHHTTQFQGRLPQVPLPRAEWIQYAQVPDRLEQRPTLPRARHGGRSPARAGQSDLPRAGLGRASGYRGGFFVTPRGQLRSAAELPGVGEHGEHHAL